MKMSPTQTCGKRHVMIWKMRQWKVGLERERAWWLRTLGTHPEDPGSIPSTRMAAHDHHQFQGI